MLRRLLLLGATMLLLAGCQTDLPLGDLKQRWGAPPSRFLPMDGIEVHWRDDGPGATERPEVHAASSPPAVASAPGAATDAADRPAILLLHGAGASLHTWDGWTQRLAPSMRVVRLDLPGFGLTGPHPSGDYTGTATVDFLERFADAAGLRRFAIAGNSLGGYYAWRFALRHPERVTALILVDAIGYPMLPGSGDALAFRLARTPLLSELMRFLPIRWPVQASLNGSYADGAKVTPDLVDRYEQLMLRPGNRAAFGDRARSERQPTGWERLREVAAPTLILWGAQDRWVPISHAERFRHDIPDSRLVIYPTLGHLPMEEDPETTARDVLRFLRRQPIDGQK
jgi:pimeloyl-ACP methyl ester carboxylesterase